MFIKLTLLVILSLILDIFWPVILVLLAFAGFRLPGGGVHLSTYSRCLVVGLILILALAKLALTMQMDPESLIFALVVVSFTAIYTIIRWVPAGTEKKKVTNPAEVKGQKLKTTAFFLLWLITCSLLLFYKQDIYALALVSGAAGGLFFITPWGYRIIHNLDNIINITGRRYEINE